MLERRPKADDRRAHTVWLTPAANPVLAKLSAVAAGHEGAVFAGLSNDEIEALERSIGKIYSNVTERKGENV